PAAIPVNIHRDVEVSVESVVDPFFNPVHPAAVDDVILRIGKNTPGYRDTDIVKAGLTHSVDQLAVGGRITPSSFTTDGFQGVTQVPANSHLLRQLNTAQIIGQAAVAVAAVAVVVAAVAVARISVIVLLTKAAG